MSPAGGPLIQLQQALEAVPLSRLKPRNQNVVTIDHTSTVGEALKILARHHILSAPLVVRPGLEDLQSMEPESCTPALLGWLDINNVMTAFLQFLEERGKALPSSMLLLMSELEKVGGAFASKMVVTVTGHQDQRLLYTTEADVPLLTAIRNFFLDGRRGGGGSGGGLVHRLAVFDAHGAIDCVISQMDVMRYLALHPSLLGPLADVSVADLGLLDGKPILATLQPQTPTVLAYKQMLAAGLSGAPVVAPITSNGTGGQLIANLSISDLRGVEPGHLSVLALPVAEFLAVLHGTSYLGFSAGASSSATHAFFAAGSGSGSRGATSPSTRRGEEDEPLRLVTITPTTSLGELVQLLVSKHVHRAYVVQPEVQPCQVTAVITPTDILKLLVRLPEGEGAQGTA